MPASTTSTHQTPPNAKLTVSFDEYMEHYAHDFYEWVDGELIPMSPQSYVHFKLIAYLFDVLRAYLDLRAIGEVIIAPFVMKLEATGSGREPDLQIILKTNPGQRTETAMIGPADICIEVVSQESVTRDYGDKLQEYEKAGVREYWLFDPARRAALFYRLNDEGVYNLMAVEDQHYRTPLLPGLVIHIPTLWQEELPGIMTIVEVVRAMLGE